MILVTIGIPSDHFNKFQKNSRKITGIGHHFIGIPAKIDKKTQVFQDSYLVTAIEKVLALVEQNNGHPPSGIGVIFLAHEWTDITKLENMLFPAAIVKRVNISHPVDTVGRAGEIYANQLIKRVREAFPKLNKAVETLVTETKNRRSRAPLFLPVRCFSSKVLRIQLFELFRGLMNDSDPQDLLRVCCEQIELAHPFVSHGADRGFFDSKKVNFKFPGRALHGPKDPRDQVNHNLLCSLNGFFRLGGIIPDGFHFDCKKGNMLRSKYSNCHDETRNYLGNPHLNIYPNDYIR